MTHNESFLPSSRSQVINSNPPCSPLESPSHHPSENAQSPAQILMDSSFLQKRGSETFSVVNDYLPSSHGVDRSPPVLSEAKSTLDASQEKPPLVVMDFQQERHRNNATIDITARQSTMVAQPNPELKLPDENVAARPLLHCAKANKVDTEVQVKNAPGQSMIPKFA